MSLRIVLAASHLQPDHEALPTSPSPSNDSANQEVCNDSETEKADQTHMSTLVSSCIRPFCTLQACCIDVHPLPHWVIRKFVLREGVLLPGFWSERGGRKEGSCCKETLLLCSTCHADSRSNFSSCAACSRFSASKWNTALFAGYLINHLAHIIVFPSRKLSVSFLKEVAYREHKLSVPRRQL